MTEPIIEFDRVTVTAAAGARIIDDLCFTVERGETFVLFGRSGSGKTTALKLMNALVLPSRGQVRFDGRPTTGWDRVELRRQAGYVIQEIALFPHFTVGRNITLVPRLLGWPDERIRARLAEVLSLVGLEESIASRHPGELSGGQRQRVGVARALAAQPPVLLMDEPFGALDPITRADLQEEFLQLRRRLQETVVLVTHDLREAMLLADRIALLEAGRLHGIFTPRQFMETGDPLVARYRRVFEAGVHE